VTWLRDTIRATAQALLSGVADEAGREVVRKIKAKWQSKAKPPDGERKTNTMTTTLEDLMRRAIVLEQRVKFSGAPGRVEFDQLDSDAPVIASVHLRSHSDPVKGYGGTVIQAVRDLCANLEDKLRKRTEVDQKVLANAGGKEPAGG
jgi:hypothetical protein